VILQIDNQPLKSSEDLQRAIQSKKVGEKMELELGREAARESVDVVLEEMPQA
jgi:S1-C subfamily serine protease